MGGIDLVGRFVLAHLQAESILRAYHAGRDSVTASLDLGLTTSNISLAASGARLPDGQSLTWETLEEVTRSSQVCFAVEENRLHKIQVFSEETQRLYSLMPTTGAPTMLISGIPMHRIKGTDPHRDTLQKIKAVSPIVGRVLDTATGLGYTAIEAAKNAGQVITIELDPAALEVARLNPWSRALFDNPQIEQRIGDSFDVIEELDDATFDRIIHDPPVFSLAGHLYSGDFYRELYRVLKPRGRLFHYIGDPESKSGRSISRGAAQRLRQAGFRRVARQPAAFGLTAYK